MGQCCTSKSDTPINVSPFQIDNDCFESIALIGRGGFGKVTLVKYRYNQKQYAMKIMSKLRIVKKKSTRSILNERKILSELENFPFIVNLLISFQDKENLYMVLDYLNGGDLRSHLLNLQKKIGPIKSLFSHEQAKFVAACCILALIHIHSKNVIHRDIKPENLILDNQGYIRITDFGIARFSLHENANETSGTPGYMAPEVMCKQPHSIAVDYFALGVILYEMAMNKRPYDGLDRLEIRDNILQEQVQISAEQVPFGWSEESIQFINQMIQRKPHDRLLSDDIDELKRHAWFKGFQWDQLEYKLIQSPLRHLLMEFRNRVSNGQNDIQVDDNDDDLQMDARQADELIHNSKFQDLFRHYDYNSYILPFPKSAKH